MSSWKCRITAAALCSGVLAVPARASSPADQQQAPAAAVATQPPAKSHRGSWDNMGMRGFSVALVLGDLAGAATPDNLPAGAKKALSDMRDFLPYKSYRLLDTHWVLCCSTGPTADVAGRLRGAEEDEYSFQINVRPANDWSELAVNFNLREAGNTESSHADLAREREEVERRLAEMRSIGRNEQHPDMVRAKEQLETARHRLAERETFDRVQAELSASRARSTSKNVLNSTFSMKVGETVVIGTSRLKGDKALIALLTAASRTTGSGR